MKTIKIFYSTNGMVKLQLSKKTGTYYLYKDIKGGTPITYNYGFDKRIAIDDYNRLIKEL